MPQSGLDESKSCYLGVDLGGTNTKLGVVTHDGQSLSRVKFRTEPTRGFPSWFDRLAKGIDEAVSIARVASDDIRAIGLATPGTMDIPAGKLLSPPNLPGWIDIPIRDLTKERFQKPTVLQNDANAASYGEYWVGAGRDAHSMVLWTLGTGIGCGIIIADMIIEGAHSHGSECGHIVIDLDSRRRSPAGQYGTLEAFASAKAIVARCREALDAGRQSSLRASIDGGSELTPLLIAEAAEAGDALADELIMDTAAYMGVGTTSLMHTIDPDMFLFGGAMTFGQKQTELGRRFLQRVRDELKVRAFPVPYERTIIDYASLGSDAGYIGAAGCARRAFGKNPTAGHV